MKKISRLLPVLIISICYTFNVPAQSKAVEIFLQTPGLECATVGISVVDLSDGRTIVGYNDQLTMVPASTMKVLTTATALDMLGSEHSIKTEVGYTGSIKNGILTGDLIIKGYGDPSLGSERFTDRNFLKSIRDNLEKNGIKRIEGDIVGDVSFLPVESVSPSWLWEDMGNYYAPGIHSLNYSDNTYRLILDTSEKGKRPEVLRTEPLIPGLEIVNNLLGYDAGFDSAYIYGAPYENRRYLHGAVRQDKNTFTVKGDIPDPGTFLVYTVSEELNKYGYLNKGYKYYTTRENKDKVLLFSSQSPSLEKLSSIINNYSDNLYAESLFRYIGAQKGKTSDVLQTISYIKDYWGKKGLKTAPLFIYDGCGLAPSNRINPTFYTSLLFYMKDNKAFTGTLPIAGREGTVRNFMKVKGLENRMRLKSGSIRQVLTYVGYISENQLRANAVQDYAIAVMVNNHTCNNSQLRKAIEKLVAGLNL